MTTNLLFGKSGLQGYFTPYVSKEIPYEALDGWVGESFAIAGEHVWFLDEDGKVVNEDLHGNSLNAIHMSEFLDAAYDDQEETDGEQWFGGILDWAAATPFDMVVIYRD